ncbi:hypothetical protein EYF80_053702 [Liparis tanakae]|uniref:Uncharacterized protein n=1 Tax=Liparis tanakae TaxID=230148 RepID=A0A4Z2F5L4_9TELE|nr:hypothetical protein EYF80_053702 [Liparis tanakae]
MRAAAPGACGVLRNREHPESVEPPAAQRVATGAAESAEPRTHRDVHLRTLTGPETQRKEIRGPGWTAWLLLAPAKRRRCIVNDSAVDRGSPGERRRNKSPIQHDELRPKPPEREPDRRKLPERSLKQNLLFPRSPEQHLRSQTLPRLPRREHCFLINTMKDESRSGLSSCGLGDVVLGTRRIQLDVDLRMRVEVWGLMGSNPPPDPVALRRSLTLRVKLPQGETELWPLEEKMSYGVTGPRLQEDERVVRMRVIRGVKVITELSLLRGVKVITELSLLRGVKVITELSLLRGVKVITELTHREEGAVPVVADSQQIKTVEMK